MKAWLRSAAIVVACFVAVALASGTIFVYTHERFAPAPTNAWVTDGDGFAFQLTGYKSATEMPPEDPNATKAVPGAIFLVVQYNVKAPEGFDGVAVCPLRVISDDGQQWDEKGFGEWGSQDACERAVAARADPGADPVVVGYAYFQIPASARPSVVGLAVSHTFGFAATPVMVYQ